MKWPVQLVVFALFGVMMLLAGRRWGRSDSPVLRPVDTVYVDREIRVRDTVTVVRPDTRVIYRTTRDTVRIEVPVPRDFRPAGVISASPIRFSRGDVVLTYFAPDASAWQQDRFDIPRPRWEYYGAGRFLAWPQGGIGVEAGIRWRMVGIFASGDVYRDGTASATVGLRLYAWGRYR